MASGLYIGLISGTSVDAVDAILLDITAHDIRLVDKLAAPPPAALRESLLEVTQNSHAISLAEFGRLDQEVALWFSDAALALIKQAGTDAKSVHAIGSHGQTIYHAPDEPQPFTLQIGDPNTIAARTNIRVVGDIRRADMAAGGQGAPMVPAFHEALFRCDSENRCILNLGGIANITTLPADRSQAILGFDTGPANALMDAWAKLHLDQNCDFGGAWAKKAQPDDALLNSMLTDAYFEIAPPKSTGREVFHLNWLQQHLQDRDLDKTVIQATLCELSAKTIADAVNNYADTTQRLLVCGGGAHNDHLMARLQYLMPKVVVEKTEQQGFDGDYVEAGAFAWIAYRRLNQLSGNVPSVTGATNPVALGGIFDPQCQN